MTNLLYDILPSPAVEQFHDALPPDDQAELGRVVTLLRLNPHPDGLVRFADGPLIAYDDGEWVLLYRVVGRTF